MIQILESKVADYREKTRHQSGTSPASAPASEESRSLQGEGIQDVHGCDGDDRGPVDSSPRGTRRRPEMPCKWITAALETWKTCRHCEQGDAREARVELFPLAAKKGCHILFRAAVGGGIPIIRSIQEGFVGGEVEHLRLHHQRHLQLHPFPDERGQPFLRSGAQGEAQAKGYAEANPTFDIEGVDSPIRRRSSRASAAASSLTLKNSRDGISTSPQRTSLTRRNSAHGQSSSAFTRRAPPAWTRASIRASFRTIICLRT